MQNKGKNGGFAIYPIDCPYFIFILLLHLPRITKKKVFSFVKGEMSETIRLNICRYTYYK